MTSSPLERDETVRGVLFSRAYGAEGPVGLAQLLGGRHLARSALRASRPLSATMLGAIDQEIGQIAEDMLDINLGDALVHGWSTYTHLTESARRTLSTPGSEVVALAKHTVTSTYRPNVDLLVDRRLVGSIAFEVRLVFDVTGLAAVLRAGSLVALCGGEVLLTATLLMNGETVAQQQRRLDPELMVALDPPVVLAVPPRTT